MTEAGLVRGKHYTTYVETMKELKRRGSYDAAEKLLLELIDATEEESRIERWRPAPAYYEHLAIVYRKLARYGDEVAVLRRFEVANRDYGGLTEEFQRRLIAAQKLCPKRGISATGQVVGAAPEPADQDAPIHHAGHEVREPNRRDTPMAKRRGFFAELQHQAAVAERDRQRASAAAVRQMQKQQREAEQSRARAERARVAASRANEKERAAAEREAKKLHAEAQLAQVESLNAALESTLADIDSVLEWTLGVDDHVDLEELRRVAEHPEFKSKHLAPLSPPAPISAPPEPTFVEPPAPTGVGAMFGKKKHAQAVELARAAFAQQHAAWQAEAAAVPMRQLEAATKHQAAEAGRVAKLAADQATYAAQSQERQSTVDAENAQLDALISALNLGEKAAVEEYFGIVFGNSVYPDPVTIDIEHSYKPEEKELEVALSLPRPEDIPTTKAYKYTKSSDEITESAQSATDQRKRYNGLVHAIVLRTLHEVWESDRLGHVDTIALTAGVEHIDPATGRPTTTPLVAVAAHRGDFESIDLAHVTPVETLKHLKAVVSKNPHALTAIDLPDGVRG